MPESAGNKIQHGIESFGILPINVDAQTGVQSFGTPVMPNVGLVSAEPDVTQEETKIYADNKVWGKLKGAKATALTIGFRYIDPQLLPYLGFKVSVANGGVSDSGIFPAHGIFYETTVENLTTGEKTKTLHYYYNVTGSQPTNPSNTDEETTEPAELSVEYSGSDSDFVVDESGNKVGYFEITRTAENAALYDTFKTQAILPTTAIPVPPNKTAKSSAAE